MTELRDDRPGFRGTLWPLLGLAALAALAALAVWCRVFGSFAGYDDEGYVMVSLRSFIEGRPLYDQTFTQYGPGYYFFLAGVHRLFDWPVTHDVTRLKTWIVWLAAAGICGMLVARITRSRSWGLVAVVLACLHLERLAMEPGHPQEMCLLGVLGALLLGTWADSGKRSVFPWLTLGAIIGVVLATKINLGVYLAAGVALAAVADGPRGRGRDRAMLLLFFAASLLPWLLMRHYLTTWHGVQLATVVTAGITTWWRSETQPPVEPPVSVRTRPQNLALALAVALLVFGWFVLAARLNGSSWSGIFQGLVLQNLEFSRLAGRFGPLFPWAALSALAAVVISRQRIESVVGRKLALLACLACILIQHLVDTLVPLEHGLQDRAWTRGLVSMATPWCAWLLLTANRRSRSFGLRLLIATAILQPLTAFPFAGTQMAVGSLPLLMVLVVAVADGPWPMRDGRTADLRPAGAMRQVAEPSLFLGAFGTVLGLRAVCLAMTYWGMQQLALPGAQWIRLPASEVHAKQALVRCLRSSCDTFLVVQMGYNSLFFWTELPPPTGLNATVWPYLLDDAQQARVVDGLRRHPRTAIVWNMADPPPLTLKSRILDFAIEHYEPAEYLGQWSIWRPSRSISVRATSPKSYPVGDLDAPGK